MRKHFPAGTFVSTPLRVLSIIQLCVVFTYLAWVGGHPFLGEIYENKVMKQKYEIVLLDSNYSKLPEHKKESIIKAYDEIQGRSASSFADKIEKSMRIIFIEIPIYLKIWVLLSILLPIFILLRIEGAIQCIWLLPLAVSCGFFASMGQDRVQTEEEKLFPSEEVLVKEYLRKPLEGGILKQREQLQEAWDLYVIKVWLGEEPAKDLEILAEQKSKGQFLFNIARTEVIQHYGNVERSRNKSGLWLLFLIWNSCLAAGVQLNERRKEKCINQNF